LRVMRDERFFTVDIAPDGDGLVSHAGAALLAETADRVGLTRELSEALAGVRERQGKHVPGRVIRDLAVMLADGGDCLSDSALSAIKSRCLERSHRTARRFAWSIRSPATQHCSGRCARREHERERRRGSWACDPNGS